MTIEELAAIRARVERATPGPWNEYAGACPNGKRVRGLSSESYPEEAIFEVDLDGIKLADLDFIEAARGDVPALLAEVERLRAEAAHLWTSGHVGFFHRGLNRNHAYQEDGATCAGCGERNPYV